jgi:hypothetical protein
MLYIVICLAGLVSCTAFRLNHKPLSKISTHHRFVTTIDNEYETSGKPKWAGGGPISDLANALIASPLFKYIKWSARRLLITNAAKRGVPWEKNRDYLATQQSTLDECYAIVENKDVVYPSYYTQEFHAYDEGKRLVANRYCF